MHRVLENPSRNPFTRPVDMSAESRTIPVLSASVSPSDPSPGDPMDVSPPASAAMGPPPQSNADSEQNSATHTNGNIGDPGTSQNTSAQPTGAAAAAQQPKVVQTAFIHKLYSMLQDPSIQHLISWSSSNESFVMSPSSDFSKVLSQYFKHTNISSFVRQLNMYGFHKVSDVFHTGSPDSPMWEFRHGNGSFRKGDLSGLREIKRRASRHALIHRDSFSTHKTNNVTPQPGTPAETAPEAPDRIATLEHSLFEVLSRFSRMEDQHALLNSKCQALTESLIRCHHWATSMSHCITSLVPDPDNPIHREAANMQREVARHADVLRALDSPNELLVPGRQPYFGNLTVDTGPPLSPRQVAQDARRTSIARQPAPPQISISPHRYGSVSVVNNTPGTYIRPQPVQQPPAPHPLSISSPPGANLGRRHTSADIRQHGWPTSGPNPFSGPQSTFQWPTSPQRAAPDQQVRDVLAKYEMGKPRQHPENARHVTPPLSLDPSQPVDGGWTAGGPKYLRPTESLPATRRSSMASNVHSLLNPAETRERAEEEEAVIEDRKRQRLQ